MAKQNLHIQSTSMGWGGKGNKYCALVKIIKNEWKSHKQKKLKNSNNDIQTHTTRDLYVCHMYNDYLIMTIYRLKRAFKVL